MIDLYSWSTANGRKISILLEEMNVPYNIFDVDITNDEQFEKSFVEPLKFITNKILWNIDKSYGQQGNLMDFL